MACRNSIYFTNPFSPKRTKAGTVARETKYTRSNKVSEAKIENLLQDQFTTEIRPEC